MKLRDLLREQETPQRYRVAIELDSGTIVLTVPIPLTALKRDDIEERLKAYIEKHKATYNIDDTSFTVWYPVDNENKKVELPDVDLPDIQKVEPTNTGIEEPKRNVATPGESDPVEEPEPETPEPETPEPEKDEPEVQSTGGLTFMTGEQFDMAEYARRYNSSRTDDNDIFINPNGVIYSDSTTPTDQNITDLDLNDPEILERFSNPKGSSISTPANPTAEQIEDAYNGTQSAIGGGKDGETGDEGVSGEEGAITGEQRAEIPSIVEELRDSISGPGTSEGQMIDALRRITSSAHLEAVVQMYRQEYGDSLPQDIIDEFKYDLGGNNAAQVEEINRVMRPLGWEIVGMRYSTMRWRKLPGVEVEIEPAGEE